MRDEDGDEEESEGDERGARDGVVLKRLLGPSCLSTGQSALDTRWRSALGAKAGQVTLNQCQMEGLGGVGGAGGVRSNGRDGLEEREVLETGDVAG